MNILQKTLSTTYPSLTMRDPVRNVLIELSEQRSRVQSLDATPTTSQSITTTAPSHASPPRVTKSIGCETKMPRTILLR